MLEFSRTVKLGDFAEGWSLPWMYFWHAEHGTLVFWSAGAMLVLWQFVTESKRADGAVYSRGLLWLGATALVYALLLLLSCGLERFVVYGRLARQMVPFACLMAAHGWVALGGRRHLTRRACWLGLLCLSGQAAANFARPFQQQFPLEVQRQVHHGYQFVARATTIDGTAVDGDGLQSRYILVNAQHFYAVQGIKPAPQGTILLRVSHPLGFIPYQYEQFTRAERAILRNADITIRLVDLYGRTP